MLPWVERIDNRQAAIVASLAAALSSRIVKRSLMHFNQHEPGEIEAGVVMVVSTGESEYSQNLGMTAKEGKHGQLLIGHLKVAEASEPVAIELAEMALIEEIKSWVRAGVSGMSFEIEAAQHSRQLEHPYGWVVVKLNAIPPRTNVY
jgi:hypothetical protein